MDICSTDAECEKCQVLVFGGLLPFCRKHVTLCEERSGFTSSAARGDVIGLCPRAVTRSLGLAALDARVAPLDKPPPLSPCERDPADQLSAHRNRLPTIAGWYLL